MDPCPIADNTLSLIDDLQGQIQKLSVLIYTTVGVLQRDAPLADQSSKAGSGSIPSLDAFKESQKTMAKEFANTWNRINQLCEQGQGLYPHSKAQMREQIMLACDGLSLNIPKQQASIERARIQLQQLEELFNQMTSFQLLPK